MRKISDGKLIEQPLAYSVATRCTSIHEKQTNSLHYEFFVVANSNGDIMPPFIIFTNPSARAGYDTRSSFKQSLTGLNSEFSFS